MGGWAGGVYCTIITTTKFGGESERVVPHCCFTGDNLIVPCARSEQYIMSYLQSIIDIQAGHLFYCDGDVKCFVLSRSGRVFIMTVFYAVPRARLPGLFSCRNKNAVVSIPASPGTTIFMMVQ